MFLSRNEGTEKCNRLHPLRLRLMCAELQCPYELPTERKRHFDGRSATWLSSLPLCRRRESTFGGNANTPAAAENTCNIHGEENSLGKEPPIVPECQEEGHRVAVRLTDDDVPETAHLAGHDKNVQGEELTSCASFDRFSRADERHSAEDVERGADVSEENNIKNQIDHGCVSRSSCSEVNATIIECGGLGEAGIQSRTPAAAHGTRHVAVGPEEDDHTQKDGASPRQDHSVTSAALQDVNAIESLLSNTVERLYTKLQGSALKVVALDDLNQQLLEAFHYQKKDAALEGERAELAIHLHSLRRQVDMLKHVWNRHEAAQLASEENRARKEHPDTRVMRVEVIHDYEKPPVPYKKRSFVPLPFATQRPRLSVETTFTSYGSSSRIATSSVVSSSQSVDVSYDSSVNSLAEYSDDFENE